MDMVDRWDEDQRRIIEAPGDSRLLVDAGPGTGKTAVACARVAWLIDEEGLSPSRIWLVCFSRTAVQELKDRIGSILRDPVDAARIVIATIDSFTWRIHSGFDREIRLGDIRSYDENISRMVDLIRSNQDIGAYLSGAEHLIIDEAQDIVGIRATLMMEFINQLSEDCGVSIFSDDAQAIYGFSIDEDQDAEEADGTTLSERVREKNPDFRPEYLFRVYRTQSPDLQYIFRETRVKVLEKPRSIRQRFFKYDNIKNDIRHQLRERAIFPEDLPRRITAGNSFILFRTRVEVLHALSLFASRPHRIRMSGLPDCIEPWIGACFFDHMTPLISRSLFFDRWKARIKNTPLATTDGETAWISLTAMVRGDGENLDLNSLREYLSRGNRTTFNSAVIGRAGPILGTIHAAKGREADYVHLTLRPRKRTGSLNDEECRVLFVGATRGRECLTTGESFSDAHGWRMRRSGRVCLSRTGSPCRVEIGRADDIDPVGVAGRAHFLSEKEVRKNQEQLRSLGDGIRIVDAELSTDNYICHFPTGKSNSASSPRVHLSSSLHQDLVYLRDKQRRKLDWDQISLPERLGSIQCYGLRTIVLAPDAAISERLENPCRESGFMVAPVIAGYPFFTFGHDGDRGISPTLRI